MDKEARKASGLKWIKLKWIKFHRLLKYRCNHKGEGKPKLSRHNKLNHANIALSCRKRHKNIENLQLIEQNTISFCFFLCLLWFMFPSYFSMAVVFQFFDKIRCGINKNFKHHKWSFVPFLIYSSVKIPLNLN